MAEEIRKINSNKEDHKSSVLEELAEIRHEMDLGNTYRDGRKEGIALGKKEGIALGKKEGIVLGKKEGIAIGKKETISTMYSNGLSIEAIAKYLKMDLEEVKKILSK